jgi:hypothetical protein
MSIFVHDSIFSIGREIDEHLAEAEILSGASLTRDIEENCIIAIINLINYSILSKECRELILSLREKEFLVLILINDENSPLVNELKFLRVYTSTFTLENFKIFFDPNGECRLEMLNKLEDEFKRGNITYTNPFSGKPLNRDNFRKFICSVILKKIIKGVN